MHFEMNFARYFDISNISDHKSMIGASPEEKRNLSDRSDGKEDNVAKRVKIEGTTGRSGQAETIDDEYDFDRFWTPSCEKRAESLRNHGENWSQATFLKRPTPTSETIQGCGGRAKRTQYTYPSSCA